MHGTDAASGPLVVGLTRAESRTAIRADLDLARFFGIGRPEDRLTALVDLTVELAARCDAQALGLADRSGPLALCVVHGDRPESDFDRLRAAAHTVDVRGEHLVLHGSRDLLSEPRWPVDMADAVRGL